MYIILYKLYSSELLFITCHFFKIFASCMNIDDAKARPQMSDEDDQQKIEDALRLLPSQFYVKRILDTDCGNGVMASAVGQKVRASVIHGLEMNDRERLAAREEFSRFEEGRVHPERFQDFKSDELYDLIILSESPERGDDSVVSLQKASRMALYALIRCSFVSHGKNIPDELKSRLDDGDFDVIDTHVSRSLATVVALCRSRNYRLLKPALENFLIEAIEDEVGAENLRSVGIFGSYTTEKQKSSSDYDLVIIADHMEEVNEREGRSPRIKRKLIEQGAEGLYAFNFYTTEEFTSADRANSWLPETIKNGYRILMDKGDLLTDILKKKKGDITKISQFAWKGAKDTGFDHLTAVQDRFRQCEELIRPIDMDIASQYATEQKRIGLIKMLGQHGIYATRPNYFELAKMLRSQVGIDIGIREAQVDAFNCEMQAKRGMYHYESIPTHQALSKVLLEHGLFSDALQHSYQALKVTYLEILHSRNVFIVDGEVTQAFLKECQTELPSALKDTMYQFSFKAEQVLGRLQIVSFDLHANGDPIFEASDAPQIIPLIEQIDEITRQISEIKASLQKPAAPDKPLVSIIIPTFNRPEALLQCLESINQLIFPEQKAEVVIVDDGSPSSCDVVAMQRVCKLPLRYVQKEHSGVCPTRNRGIRESKGEFLAFIDDDVLPSPLWLLHVMSGFTKQSVAGVGSTVYTQPMNHYLADYTDYRELERQPFVDKTGQILNVLTGNVCFRKNALEEIGGFNESQSDAGIPVGGDDVDLTWKIRERGYSLGYADSASVFHHSRTSIRSLMKQHVGYGAGTMFHCLTANRPPSELGIPNPTIEACLKDILSYAMFEVPKRFVQCYGDNLGLKKSITYPLLDLIRKASYVWGILKTRPFISSSRTDNEETR